ncbi:hypothetical protein ACQPZ2_30735 [Nocardia pseudovaccinii]|uniref:hypothetical protein n=1 Tax=Nocardia pseudovaccinii TaxID=189540 RepID=UPI003D89FB3C
MAEVVNRRAEVVLELFERFAAGDTLIDIARSFAERGWPIPRTTIQGMLHRQYAREIVGDELFQRVQDILNDPERAGRVREAQSGRHLLSRRVNCSICGRYAEIASGVDVVPRLRCFQKRDHSVSTGLVFADSLVEKFVLENASDPRFGELVQERDPKRAWIEAYPLSRKREIIGSALYIQLCRTGGGRGYYARSIKIEWKKIEGMQVSRPTC